MIQGVTSWIYRKSQSEFVSADIVENITDKIRVPLSFVEGNKVDIDQLRNWREDLKDAIFCTNEAGAFLCKQEVEKMSKSKYNVVNPDDIISKYGSDVFRMYEMFLGPIEDSKPWDTNGIEGVRKFINKFIRLFYKEENWIVKEDAATEEELKILHQSIKKITNDIERYSFNTCISQFMIVTNELTKLKCHKREVLEQLLKILAPFAPFYSEELWHKLGNENSVHQAEWPAYDESKLVESSIEYPVMINGKKRLTINLAADINQDVAKETVLSDEAVVKWTEGKDPKKFIFVQGRIVNIVV